MEAFGNVIKAWLKMNNMFFRWKKIILDTLTFQWKHKVCKQQLDATYEGKAKEIKIRSKWYEHGEKPLNFP